MPLTILAVSYVVIGAAYIVAGCAALAVALGH